MIYAWINVLYYFSYPLKICPPPIESRLPRGGVPLRICPPPIESRARPSSTHCNIQYKA